jgi:hypothetical protein
MYHNGHFTFYFLLLKPPCGGYYTDRELSLGLIRSRKNAVGTATAKSCINFTA